MCLFIASLLFLSVASISNAQFLARFNMGGARGQVQFNSTSKMATLNISGVGSCDKLNLSLSVFPLMYGHFAQPCSDVNIGSPFYAFMANLTSPSSINVSNLFEQRLNLDDLSLSFQKCDGVKVCAVVSQGQTLLTRQARFTESVIGNVYIRSNVNNTNHRLLADLATVGQVSLQQTNITIFGTTSDMVNCSALLGNLASSSLINLGVVNVGTLLPPQKSRIDLTTTTRFSFLLLNIGSGYTCAQLYDVPAKEVRAVMNMQGVKGSFIFKQASPFDLTQINVNLTNLQGQVGPYHVHLFPVPSVRSDLCSNDNVGGHLNPFAINTTSPLYPNGSGSTHDKYEMGDLSSKHMSLAGKNSTDDMFIDFNLPLFGANSIVGRSVVIHKIGGARFVCASIGYPGEVNVGRATFQDPVVGNVWFTQLVNHPLSDVSIFMDLSYGVPSTTPTQNHNWHVHVFPISSETDGDAGRCGTTGGHWNPFSINTTDGTYASYCNSSCPLCCEAGDLANKQGTINLDANVGAVDAKHFFTDVASWLSISGIIGRSMVIHEANRGSPRIACANITLVRVPAAGLSSWLGPGASSGQVRFSQSVPQGPTTINVSLANLNYIAGGYHVHILPLRAGSVDPCSNANILGHYNPLAWNTSMSPSPGVGTVDQYEIGDISGKFGLLTNQNNFDAIYDDPNMPLTGPYSIVGRSVVVHYNNGSRLRCATISADRNTDGQWTIAKAVFSGAVMGTVKLLQQMFPDGSRGDVTLEMDLNSANPNIITASLFIATGRADVSNLCNRVGSIFNPLNMTSSSSSCSLVNQLGCVMGDVSARQGNISLVGRELYTDSVIQLSGDNTVVYRSLVLRSGGSILACADILPESQSATQTFPNVNAFSRSLGTGLLAVPSAPAVWRSFPLNIRYDFRNRVASVLGADIARVTILPGSPLSASNSQCQQVTYMISGTVSTDLLNSVKTSNQMGQFKESATCTSTVHSGSLLMLGSLPLTLMFAVACLLQTLL